MNIPENLKAVKTIHPKGRLIRYLTIKLASDGIGNCNNMNVEAISMILRAKKINKNMENEIGMWCLSVTSFSIINSRSYFHIGYLLTAWNIYEGYGNLGT